MSSSIVIPRLQPYFLPKLYYFYYVAQFSSYSKAALALNITRSSLSREVRVLEQRLKTVLLLRSTRRVSLTQEGSRVVEYLKDFLGGLNNIENCIQGKCSAKAVQMTLIVPEHLLCDYFLKSLEAFRQQRSDLACDIQISGSSAVQSSKQVVSICLGFDPASTCVQKPILSFEGGLYVGKSYAARWGMPFTVEDLSKHRLLIVAPTVPGVFADMNWHTLLAPKPGFAKATLLVNSAENVRAMAESGFGIMAGVRNHPSLINSTLVEILHDVSVLHGPRSQAYFVCEQSSFTDAGVQALYLHLRQALCFLQHGSTIVA